MTVPESAAAVFERVLGDLAMLIRHIDEGLAMGITSNAMPRAWAKVSTDLHAIHAQLATALRDDLSRSEGKSSELSDSGTESLTAQPDTLGDGGGVAERPCVIEERSESDGTWEVCVTHQSLVPCGGEATATEVIDAIEETFLGQLPSKALSYCAQEDVNAGLDAMRERFGLEGDRT